MTFGRESLLGGFSQVEGVQGGKLANFWLVGGLFPILTVEKTLMVGFGEVHGEFWDWTNK